MQVDACVCVLRLFLCTYLPFFREGGGGGVQHVPCGDCCLNSVFVGIYSISNSSEVRTSCNSTILSGQCEPMLTLFSAGVTFRRPPPPPPPETSPPHCPPPPRPLFHTAPPSPHYLKLNIFRVPVLCCYTVITPHTSLLQLRCFYCK
jgi:hypothetical protein